MRKGDERLERAIQAASKEVPSQISAYKGELGDVLASGFKVELLGAGLLIIGVIFGTLPAEISWTFGGS